MAIGFTGLPALHPVDGIKIGVAKAKIKYPDRIDTVVFELCDGAETAAVFTQNAFCAAPVLLAKQHLAQARSRYWIVNTGNANAGTGTQGLQDALVSCETVAGATGCKPEQVLPFSTGVIGEYLPMDRLLPGLEKAVANCQPDAWKEAAQGILTTDTVPKACSRQIDIDGHTVTFTGIAKGSGMIRPDMATMLAYIATDAKITPPLLQQCLAFATDRSFNRITVDGDTSTNDACMLAATQKSDMPIIDDPNSSAYQLFQQTILEICQTLAQAIVKDGEGATKFMTITVEQGESEAECAQVAYTIAHSPLVKTAFFASDPNWGRILAAVGRSHVENFDLQGVDIFLNDVCIVRQGAKATDYTEARGQAVMKLEEITICVVLSRGSASSTVWTSDLSYDYVKINAEYRS